MIPVISDMVIEAGGDPPGRRLRETLMSTRHQIKPQHVINAGSIASATITSSVTIVDKISLVAYQFIWTGSSPSGTIIVQGSNNYAVNPDGSVANSGTWTTLYFNVAGTPAASITVTGNSSSAVAEIPLTGLYALRAVYTKISGTGTLDAYVCGKVT